VVMKILSGIETRATRATGRRLGKMLFEYHPVGCKPIEIGGLHAWMPHGRQAVSAPLVRRDKKDVHRCLMAGPGNIIECWGNVRVLSS